MCIFVFCLRPQGQFPEAASLKDLPGFKDFDRYDTITLQKSLPICIPTRSDWHCKRGCSRLHWSYLRSSRPSKGTARKDSSLPETERYDSDGPFREESTFHVQKPQEANLRTVRAGLSEMPSSPSGSSLTWHYVQAPLSMFSQLNWLVTWLSRTLSMSLQSMIGLVLRLV